MNRQYNKPSRQTLQTKIFIWNTQRCLRMDSTQDQIHALCQLKPTVMSFARTATIIILFSDKYPNPTMNRKEKLGSQNLVGRRGTLDCSRRNKDRKLRRLPTNKITQVKGKDGIQWEIAVTLLGIHHNTTC